MFGTSYSGILKVKMFQINGYCSDMLNGTNMLFLRVGFVSGISEVICILISDVHCKFVILELLKEIEF